MSDDPIGPHLEECPVCGAVGLPERIVVHDCVAFLARITARRDHTLSAENGDANECDSTASTDSQYGDKVGSDTICSEEKP